MTRIVFYDGCTDTSYSEASIEIGANRIGGTEMAVARVASRLSEAHHVTVAQDGREFSEGSARLQWIPLAESGEELARADAIVVLRRPRDMISLRRLNKDVPLFMWYHDWNYPVRSFKPVKVMLRNWLRTEAHPVMHHLARVNAVGVSQTHARNIREHLAEARVTWPLAARVPVDYVYNPIPADLARSDADYDPTKLVFFSAAWKGLDMVIKAFQSVRQTMPDMRLYVASPSYADRGVAPTGAAAENITHLGSLSPADVIAEVRSALCVFYPANRVPETFGCVFAEAHAVGTPVLAHPGGAACELLGGDELVDARDLVAVVERVRSWREGARPIVCANEEMTLSSVARAWERLLLGAEQPSALDDRLLLAAAA
jgi:glycosyltransferase involved in cell wall biosynthesis